MAPDPGSGSIEAAIRTLPCLPMGRRVHSSGVRKWVPDVHVMPKTPATWSMRVPFLETFRTIAVPWEVSPPRVLPAAGITTGVGLVEVPHEVMV